MQLKEEPQTVLTHDTRTVEPSQVTTCFCGSWMGTVEMAKTTTNFCSSFKTGFGSCFYVFFCPGRERFRPHQIELCAIPI